MLTTEKQAASNWCPMVRIARREETALGDRESIVAGCNTDALGKMRVPNSCKCIGRGCMMWRWDEAHTLGLRHQFIMALNPTATTEPKRSTQDVPAGWEWSPYCPGDESPAARWIESELDILARRVGYCGLAGMPVGIAKQVSECAR